MISSRAKSKTSNVYWIKGKIQVFQGTQISNLSCPRCYLVDCASTIFSQQIAMPCFWHIFVMKHKYKHCQNKSSKYDNRASLLLLTISLWRYSWSTLIEGWEFVTVTCVSDTEIMATVKVRPDPHLRSGSLPNIKAGGEEWSFSVRARPSCPPPTFAQPLWPSSV